MHAMRCIFCMSERPPSLEHIFPLAIGGTITTDRVCKPCNDMLGSRVDAALSNFLPIRQRRAELKLAGHGREAPQLFEMLLGDHTLIGPEAKRIQTRFNKKTGRLDLRQLYHAADVVLPNGKKALHITLDARDKDQFPKAIQRERKRRGLPPLSDEAMAAEISKCVEQTIEHPLVQVNFSISFAFLRHALIKIAYELAFRWLGEAYLDDPMAAALRESICKDDMASTDGLDGFIGELPTSGEVFRFWTPQKAHHLALATVLPRHSIIIAARIFDLYAVAMPVTRDPTRYLQTAADASKIRFLAIDAANRRTIETTWQEELHRIARAMSMHGRNPPFPDPLSDEKPFKHDFSRRDLRN